MIPIATRVTAHEMERAARLVNTDHYAFGWDWFLIYIRVPKRFRKDTP